MVENRPTRSAPPPVRTLLHRGLPEPLPPRSTWPPSVLVWFPLVMFLIVVLPVTFDLMYDDLAPDFPSVVAVTVALLAGFTAIGYELVALVRRRRRRRRHRP